MRARGKTDPHPRQFSLHYSTSGIPVVVSFSAIAPGFALPPRRRFPTPLYLLHPWSRASMQSSRGEKELVADGMPYLLASSVSYTTLSFASLVSMCTDPSIGFTGRGCGKYFRPK